MPVLFYGTNERYASRWYMCIVDRDTVAMVTIILCFCSPVLEIESPYISYAKNKK